MLVISISISMIKHHLGWQMSIFLKIVSGIYLLMVWAAFLIALTMRDTQLPIWGSNDLGSSAPVAAFFICLGFSIPAAVLYAFGQIVGDVRASRNHLEAMRRYYEPR